MRLGRRGSGPTRRQALGEQIYEIGAGAGRRAGASDEGDRLWFPYVATLMIFIWVVNMLGFIPLPLSDERWEVGGVEVPTLAIFAATSTLSVTLALALMTLFTHIEASGTTERWRTSRAGFPTFPRRCTR